MKVPGRYAVRLPGRGVVRVPGRNVVRVPRRDVVRVPAWGPEGALMGATERSGFVRGD